MRGNVAAVQCLELFSGGICFGRIQLRSQPPVGEGCKNNRHVQEVRSFLLLKLSYLNVRFVRNLQSDPSGSCSSPDCEARAHLTLLSVSAICRATPGNQHVVVGTFSHNWVNVRHCNELDENALSFEALAHSRWDKGGSHSAHTSHCHYLSCRCDAQPGSVSYRFTVTGLKISCKSFT